LTHDTTITFTPTQPDHHTLQVQISTTSQPPSSPGSSSAGALGRRRRHDSPDDQQNDFATASTLSSALFAPIASSSSTSAGPSSSSLGPDHKRARVRSASPPPSKAPLELPSASSLHRTSMTDTSSSSSPQSSASTSSLRPLSPPTLPSQPSPLRNGHLPTRSDPHLTSVEARPSDGGGTSSNGQSQQLLPMYADMPQLDRGEFVRLALQAMRDCGYSSGS
jgi:hypothetical protein